MAVIRKEKILGRGSVKTFRQIVNRKIVYSTRINVYFPVSGLKEKLYNPKS